MSKESEESDEIEADNNSEENDIVKKDKIDLKEFIYLFNGDDQNLKNEKKFLKFIICLMS